MDSEFDENDKFIECQNKKIAEYLEHVNEQFSFCPKDWRKEQTDEIRAHILALVEDRITVGLSRVEAIDAALVKLGNPKKLGHELYKQRGREMLPFPYRASKFRIYITEALSDLYFMNLIPCMFNRSAPMRYLGFAFSEIAR
jgi:hypothetical protein